MSFDSIDSFIVLLELGNFEEKQYALSGLLKCSNIGSMFNIDRVVLCLIHTDQAEIVHKIFILLSHLAVQNNACKRRLIKNSAIYHFANKILSSCTVKKIIGVLYFFTAVLYPTLTNDSSFPMEDDSLTIDAKAKIRAMGILNQMCFLFLQTNVDSAVWPLLCQCICECCTGVAENQNLSSHILPKCLKYLEGNFQLDLVNLVISLIRNNDKIQEKFVQLEGIQCILRNLLNTPKGLELLCVSMTNCGPAVQAAKMCNMVQFLDSINVKANAASPSVYQLMLSKWSSLGLWILQHFDNKQKDEDKNKSTQKPGSHPCSSKKDQIQDNSVASLDNESNMETSQKTTLKSSFLSKFDAVSSFQSKSSRRLRNSVSASNIIHPYQHSNSHNTKLSHGDNQNINFLKDNMENSKCLRSGRFKVPRHIVSNNKNSSKIKQKMYFTFHDNVSNEDKENIFSSKNLFKTQESFADFQPKFTSSPRRPARNISPSSDSSERQNNIFRISAMTNQSKQKESFTKFTNKGTEFNKQTENTTDLFHESAHSTSFKVRHLVERIIEMNSKNETDSGDSLNNDSPNVMYYLKPNKMTKYSSNLQKYLNLHSTSKMSGLNYSIFAKQCRNDVEDIVDGTGTVPKISEKLEASVGSKTGSIFGKQKCDACGNLSIASFPGNDMQNVIKHLKIGISLYGCDFQKISDTFWSRNKQITAIFLYEVFYNHIVKK